MSPTFLNFENIIGLFGIFTTINVLMHAYLTKNSENVLNRKIGELNNRIDNIINDFLLELEDKEEDEEDKEEDEEDKEEEDKEEEDKEEEDKEEEGEDKGEDKEEEEDKEINKNEILKEVTHNQKKHIQLKKLLKDGQVINLYYLKKTFTAEFKLSDKSPNGYILKHGKEEYNNPSHFSFAKKSELNPYIRADNGWDSLYIVSGTKESGVPIKKSLNEIINNGA